MRTRNCQCYNVEEIPQNELTQLQHLFAQYYEYTILCRGNKHCVPNMVKLVM
jgi:hypothetical protein